MTALRDAIATAPSFWLTTVGFILGVVFGALIRHTNYCMMGAISDWRLTGDRGRLGAAALAAATAIITTQWLDWAGVTDTSKSIYLVPRVNWAGAIAGGLLFGYGMVYAGGCPSRALARAGGGDIRAIVTMLVMAVAALAVLSGILGSARVAFDGATAADLTTVGYTTQSLAEVVRHAGAGDAIARPLAALLIAGPLIVFAIRSGRILSHPLNLAGGLGVGLVIAAGWAITGLAHDEMSASPAAPTSLSFVKPVADAIDWIERSTALGLPGFAAASVFGVLVGAFFAAARSGALAMSGFTDRGDLLRHIFGGAAMGIGGITAMGCTIGQGVSGISTLSLQSVVAVAAIVAGAVIAIGRLQRDM